MHLWMDDKTNYNDSELGGPRVYNHGEAVTTVRFSEYKDTEALFSYRPYRVVILTFIGHPTVLSGEERQC